MSQASLELSVELSRLSGWETGYWLSEFKGVNSSGVPAYDLGYLLRKLPAYIEGQNLTIYGGLDDKWYAQYVKVEVDDYTSVANTPEDAVALLAIELFKQGVLAKGEQQ